MDLLNQEYVDAIEEGRIVRVTRDYAKKEGLLILRGVVEGKKEEPKQPVYSWKNKYKRTEEARMLFDDFRKPLHWRKDQVFTELIDNFHWDILKARKSRNLTRKQVAAALNCSENDIKNLESGILPSHDFVLINKVQKYFGINLRKDKKDFSDESRKLVDYKTRKEKMDERKAAESNKTDGAENILGSNMEVIDQ